jgi:hypothetical protein
MDDFPMKNARNFYFGLAIGVALLAGCLCCAKISGACHLAQPECGQW